MLTILGCLTTFALIFYNDALTDDQILEKFGKMEKDIRRLQEENIQLKQQNLQMLHVLSNYHLDTKLTGTERSFRTVSRIPASENIAFAVNLNYSMQHLGRLETIKYNHVILNEGQTFDVNRGIFTVPAKGIYLVSVTLWESLNNSQRIGVDLIVNGKRIIPLFADGAGNSDSAMTQTLPIIFNQGDNVWVRVHDSYDGMILYGNPEWSMNSFSAILISYL